jgi:Putative Ig domain
MKNSLLTVPQAFSRRGFLNIGAAAAAASVLAACGGGGGDQVAATTPVTPVTAPVVPVNHTPTFASANTSSSVTLMSQPAIISLPYATDVDSGDTLTYTVSNLPTGVTYDPATHSLSISPTTTPNTYTLSIVATDKGGASATMTVSLDISLAMPTWPALADVWPLLDRGGNPITFSLNALAGLPAGSQIIGVTGFPRIDAYTNPTNLTCDTSGNCSITYDVDSSILGFKDTIAVIIEVSIPGYQLTLKRTQNIIIENEA